MWKVPQLALGLWLFPSQLLPQQNCLSDNSQSRLLSTYDNHYYVRTLDYDGTPHFARGARVVSTLFPDTSARHLLWKPFDAKTIGTQILTGAAGAVIGTGLLFGAYYLAFQGDVDLTGFILFTAASSLVFPTGVYLGGRWSGGNGSWLWTTIGSLGAGGLMLVPNILANTGDMLMSYARVVVFAYAGAILGYHLSARPVYQSENANVTARILLFPQHANRPSHAATETNVTIASLSISI